MCVLRGVLIRTTPNKEQASQDAPPGTLAERLGHPSQETGKQPVLVSISMPSLPVKPPPIIPPPRVPPVAVRLFFMRAASALFI